MVYLNSIEPVLSDEGYMVILLGVILCGFVGWFRGIS